MWVSEAATTRRHPQEAQAFATRRPANQQNQVVVIPSKARDLQSSITGSTRSSAETAPSVPTWRRVGKHFGRPAQFWLNLQNDYDLRIAERNGIGKGIKPLNVPYDAELAGSRRL
jgi:plasmid maintenance system antidote protein VapI